MIRIAFVIALLASLPAAPAGAAALDFGTTPHVGAFGTVSLARASTSASTSVGNWSINDTRLLATGWHVNVGATQFRSSAGDVLPIGSLTYRPPTVTAGSAQLLSLYPVLLVSRATPVAIDLSADGSRTVALVQALPATGGGLWNFTQGPTDLTLTVPATARATTYTSTISFTLSSGIL
jgi:hypothetical protein